MTILHMTPNIKLLFSNPVHFFSLGFGSGLAPKAPGTFGTLVGLPLYWLIHPLVLNSQLILILFLFLVGIYFCQKTGDALGVSDHGGIVWDEIVAMMLVLTFTPLQWTWWAVAFILFRLFDIWKPFPIRQLDANLKGGLGVMLDDLLAALYAIAVLKVLLWMSSQV
jgi:phosphatidylglycerophosphatase A